MSAWAVGAVRPRSSRGGGRPSGRCAARRRRSGRRPGRGGRRRRCALVLILRRNGPHLAGVFRVELVNPAAVGFVGQVSAAGAQAVAAGPATTEVRQSSTAETFDIGVTYAEEMRQKQEALRQQEEAVFRHIFELN